MCVGAPSNRQQQEVGVGVRGLHEEEVRGQCSRRQHGDQQRICGGVSLPLRARAVPSLWVGGGHGRGLKESPEWW